MPAFQSSGERCARVETGDGLHLELDMTSVRDFRRAATAAAIAFWTLVAAPAPNTQAQEPEGNYGVGIPDVFLPKYLEFRTSQLASGTPHTMRIKLGFVKGLSKSFTSMVGEARIPLDA